MKRLVLLLVIIFVAMGAVQAQTEWDEVEEYYKEEFRDNLKKAQAGDAFARLPGLYEGCFHRL